MKLLIIEDDINILAFLKRGFKEEGFIVDSAIDGEDGEYLISTKIYDVIILDWMLPKKKGLEILKSLRKKNITTPTIILSAKGEIKDKVSGLSSGADDYLSKPFSFAELLARVEALYRRGSFESLNIIETDMLSVNVDTKSVRVENKNIELTSKEYELLLFLIKHKNSLVSTGMIEEQLWNNQDYINSNVVQVTVYHLRKKLGKECIKSFRGLGYKIEI